MTSIEQATGERPAFIGREGISIPTYPVSDRTTRGIDLLSFFDSLWALNGFETSIYEGFGHRRQRAYQHELVLPADRDRPLTVLRGSYTPTSPDTLRHYEDRADRDRSLGSSYSVQTGIEKHVVLLPPAKAGQFIAQLSVRFAHSYGISSGIASFTDATQVREQDEYINMGDFYPKNPETEGWNAAAQTMYRDYGKALDEAMARTLELLA